MTQIILNIPDSQLQRVLDGLVRAWGGPARAPAQAQLNFVQRFLAAEVRRTVLDAERREAVESITEEPDVT